MDTAKLFKIGNSQVICLPQGYQLPGTKVYIKHMGNALVILPAYDSWQPLLDSLDIFSEDFMAERMQPPVQVRKE